MPGYVLQLRSSAAVSSVNSPPAGSTSAILECLGSSNTPAYRSTARRDPSGDQEGAPTVPPPCVSRRGSPPAASTRYTSVTISRSQSW